MPVLTVSRDCLSKRKNFFLSVFNLHSWSKLTRSPSCLCVCMPCVSVSCNTSTNLYETCYV
jgi:hypothetical protein